MRRLLIVFVLFLSAAPLTAQEQPGVRVDGVPEPLRLPMPEGSNKVMTAEMTEGNARSGWISPVGHPDARVMLNPAGDGTFRINLASTTLYSVLNALGAEAFRVYLKTTDGDVVRSMQITFAQGNQSDVRLSARLIPTENKKKSRKVEHGHWYQPGDYKALRIRTNNLPQGSELTAQTGEQSIDVLSLTNNRYEIELNEENRKRWRQHTELEIKALWNDEQLERLCLKAKPEHLVAEGESRTFTVRQRGYHELPGSSGLIMISLGDVTGGQVAVDIRSLEKNVKNEFVDSKSLRAGEHVTFEYEGQTYRLELEELMNALVGEDYAEFTLSRTREMIVNKWSGADSDIQQSRFLRIESKQQWQEVWKKHSENEDPPGVDFSEHMVIGIFTGKDKNSRGVELMSVRENDRTIRMRFDVRSDRTAGGEDVVYPFGLLVTKKTEKDVVLEENVQEQLGKPPVWKQRARLSSTE